LQLSSADHVNDSYLIPICHPVTGVLLGWYQETVYRYNKVVVTELASLENLLHRDSLLPGNVPFVIDADHE